MKKFRIPVVQTIYGFVEIEAKSENEAINSLNIQYENDELDLDVDMILSSTEEEFLTEEIEEVTEED